MYNYICPLCLIEQVSNDPFLRCCGHYMVELQDWNIRLDKWLIARDHEISLLGLEKQLFYRERWETYHELSQ